MALESPILLIEENEADARALKENLLRAGIATSIRRLTCPTDAKSDLQAAATGNTPLPAAIILGLGLEARVGFELVRWIRDQPELSRLVVITLGEIGQLREVQEAYASGANAYFVKGPDCAPLIRTLQSAFSIETNPPNSKRARDTHPAFRNSTDLYRSAATAEGTYMAKAPLLLVDDDDTHTRQFTLTIESLRIRNALIRVGSGDEAIEYLAGAGVYADRNSHPFPIIVFLDIRLPDSHKLLAWMEGHPSARPAGIIALTSSHDMRPVIQAYHLGVHSFLKEPPKLEELRNALSAIPNTELVSEQGGHYIQLKRSGA